jgi:hypothetical protein
MRKVIGLLTAVPVILLASVRAYEIAPVRNLTGWSQPGPTQSVQQTLRCTFDQALYAEVFIGQPDGSGLYNFELCDADGRRIYSGSNDLFPLVFCQ